MIKRLLICVVPCLSLSALLHGMDELRSSHGVADKGHSIVEYIEKLNHEIIHGKQQVAKQIVPCMQQYIEDKAPKISEVEKIVLLLQMLDSVLPRQPLAKEN